MMDKPGKRKSQSNNKAHTTDSASGSSSSMAGKASQINLTRKEKNRLSAIRSRQRKQELVSGLETKIQGNCERKQALLQKIANLKDKCDHLSELWEASRQAADLSPGPMPTCEVDAIQSGDCQDSDTTLAEPRLLTSHASGTVGIEMDVNRSELPEELQQFLDEITKN